MMYWIISISEVLIDGLEVEYWNFQWQNELTIVSIIHALIYLLYYTNCTTYHLSW